MNTEIILAAIGISMILGMAAGATFLAFFFLPWLSKRAKEKRFPLVTKQGLRVAKIPVRGIKLADIDKALDLFVDRAVSHGRYDRKALLSELGRTYLQLVRAVNDEGERYIIDAYGRKIAGDNDGETMRVVVLDSDKINTIALFHELGHTAHEIKGKVDFDHTDDIMWHEIVGWCKKEFGS